MDFQGSSFDASAECAAPENVGAERRSEPRRPCRIDHATLVFRSQVHVVPVVNISSRGTMIESDLEPRLGESVTIRFAGCSPIYAFVRWTREGRIGLNFGCEMILGGVA